MFFPVVLAVVCAHLQKGELFGRVCHTCIRDRACGIFHCGFQCGVELTDYTKSEGANLFPREKSCRLLQFVSGCVCVYFLKKVLTVVCFYF